MNRKNKFSFNLSFALIVFLAFASSLSHSRAELIQIKLQGTVAAIEATDTFGGSGINFSEYAVFQNIFPFGIGSPVEAIFTYDTTTAAISTGTGFARYPSGNFSIMIGTTSFNHDASNRNTFVYNDHTTNHDTLANNLLFGYADLFDNSGIQYTQYGNVTRTFNGRIFLTDSTRNLFNSTSLPTAPFSLSDLTSATWQISDSAGSTGGSTWTTPLGSHTGMRHLISGNFTSLEFTAVPEPSSLLLTTLALFGIGGMAPRRRRR
jgi:hypothetical protein